MVYPEGGFEAILRLRALRVVGAGVVDEHVQMLLLRQDFVCEPPNILQRG